MEPLIEIKTVPIAIEMKINDAQIEYHRGTAEMQIDRSNGGLNIKSSPIKLRMDTFEARSSVSPTPTQSVRQSAQKGKQAAYSATAMFAQRCQLFLNAKVGQDVIGQISSQVTDKKIQTNIGIDFIPNSGVNMDWTPGDIQIRYEMDKLNFDWKIEQPQFQFTPGNIEISVAQQPDVVIEYVGGPLYAPPSSNPNFEHIDTEA